MTMLSRLSYSINEPLACFQPIPATKYVPIHAQLDSFIIRQAHGITIVIQLEYPLATAGAAPFPSAPSGSSVSDLQLRQQLWIAATACVAAAAADK